MARWKGSGAANIETRAVSFIASQSETLTHDRSWIRVIA